MDAPTAGADHPNAGILRGLLDAFAASDVPAMEAALAEDLVWHAPGTSRFSGRFEGRDAALQRLDQMREAGVSTSFDVHDVVANDEHAVALVHLHLETADGRRYDQPQVQVVHVRRGRIVELWVMNQDQAVLDELLGG
jgi:ketosteroid isomerase-like protein